MHTCASREGRDDRSGTAAKPRTQPSRSLQPIMKNKNSIENEVLTLAHKRIDAFAAEVDSGVESWKALHGEAMACRDLDVTLQRGIALYDAFVTTYDEMWTAEIAGKIEHSDARDAAFRKLFEMWLVPCKLVETAIKHFADRGYEVEHAKPFRDRYAQAVWSLKSPAELFDHPKFEKLRGEASDAVQRGDVEPLGE